MRVAGCDLGRTSVALALLDVSESGELTVAGTRNELHEGRPFDVLMRWYDELQLADFAALAATGIYADELSGPVDVLPEEACGPPSVLTARCPTRSTS
jgi:hypothetical protein